MKKKSKKSVSSEDFLDLLEHQEEEDTSVAFKPKGARATKAKFQLSPIQKEILGLAYRKSPRFVQKLVTSPQAKSLVKTLESSYLEVIKRVENFKR